MKTILRKATADDVAVLTEIIRVAFRDVAERFDLNADNCPKHPSNCRPEWIEGALKKGVAFFILQADDLPVGCVGLERATPELCYLERLAVLPEHRRRGHGRSLVGHAEAVAKDIGANTIQIGIIAAQTDLKAWYAAAGYRETDMARFDHLPFDVQFMVKPLF